MQQANSNLQLMEEFFLDPISSHRGIEVKFSVSKQQNWFVFIHSQLK